MFRLVVLLCVFALCPAVAQPLSEIELKSERIAFYDSCRSASAANAPLTTAADAACKCAAVAFYRNMPPDVVEAVRRRDVTAPVAVERLQSVRQYCVAAANGGEVRPGSGIAASPSPFPGSPYAGDVTCNTDAGGLTRCNNGLVCVRDTSGLTRCNNGQHFQQDQSGLIRGSDGAHAMPVMPGVYRHSNGVTSQTDGSGVTRFSDGTFCQDIGAGAVRCRKP